MKLRRHMIIGCPQNHQKDVLPRVPNQYDVFINHRGIDTKRNMASLLYHQLSRLNARPFLDKNTMKPGDNLFKGIENAIRDCKVGVAVFSPHYGESYYCLLELALMMEYKKKIIPVFFDIMPAELQIVDHEGIYCTPDELERFNRALEEAKSSAGLVFNSSNG
ncbi:hypothetical protein CRG98_023325 [Punica granatum]|nr:hypothetical protein CRG98_023325 [Punica granatum]